MSTQIKPEASVCPTCGNLLPTAQLAQLNATMANLITLHDKSGTRYVEGVHKQIEAITREIEAVSQTMRIHPTIATQ